MICSYASYSVVSKSEFIVMIWWKCTENVRMSRTYNNIRSSPRVCRNFVAPDHGWKISAPPPLDRERWGRLIDYRVWSIIRLPYQKLEISADPLGLLNIIIPGHEFWMFLNSETANKFCSKISFHSTNIIDSDE